MGFQDGDNFHLKRFGFFQVRPNIAHRVHRYTFFPAANHIRTLGDIGRIDLSNLHGTQISLKHIQPVLRRQGYAVDGFGYAGVNMHHFL